MVEMASGMKKVVRGELSPQAVKHIFEVFDKDPKDGFIEKKEMHLLFLVRDPEDANEAYRIFKDSDTDHDGKLSQDEFTQEALRIIWGEKGVFVRNAANFERMLSQP